MCMAINADGRQVNKGAYTSPGEAGGYLQKFLVLVHAIVAGRLRGVEAGQHEGCGEPDDGLRGARCHGRFLRRSTLTHLPHHPIRTGTNLPAASTSVVSSGVHSNVRTERYVRRNGA